MPGKEGAEESREAASAEEIRFTDRRRVRLDDDAEDGVFVDNVEESDPKPEGPSPELQQMEVRASAAERKLIEVQARFDQLRAQMQRETDEIRQRLNRTAEERLRTAKADFIASLLPVADNLRRAIQVADAGSIDGLLEGVRGTAAGFESALASAGVEAVSSVGAKFDPELHEAVDTVEVESELDGTITAEYSSGYKMGDRLLRPARVQVGRAASD
ncbi:MAG: nucleotide exchange factor GrpE [Pyrinomonadaceae bacterium]